MNPSIVFLSGILLSDPHAITGLSVGQRGRRRKAPFTPSKRDWYSSLDQFAMQLLLT